MAKTPMKLIYADDPDFLDRLARGEVVSGADVNASYAAWQGKHPDAPDSFDRFSVSLDDVIPLDDNEGIVMPRLPDPRSAAPHLGPARRRRSRRR